MKIKQITMPIYNYLKCSLLRLNNSPAEKRSIYIGKESRIINPDNITLSKGVIIGKYNYLASYGIGKLEIGEGTNIGMYGMIASINTITIGTNVLFGPNVYIADYNHCYENVNIPISQQGLRKFNRGIIIGDDSWIGKNVTIIGGCSIGKHCIIGANSFVNRDIPDYTVCAGNPCKVVKKYNFESKKWEKV